MPFPNSNVFRSSQWQEDLSKMKFPLWPEHYCSRNTNNALYSIKKREIDLESKISSTQHLSLNVHYRKILNVHPRLIVLHPIRTHTCQHWINIFITFWPIRPVYGWVCNKNGKQHACTRMIMKIHWVWVMKKFFLFIYFPSLN